MNLREYYLRRHWKRKGVKISRGTRLETSIKIGYGTRINGSFLAKGKAACSIGRYCALGEDIRLISSNHDIRFPNVQCFLQNRIRARDLETTRGDIKIGSNAWIGDSVTILTGVTIGDGAVIGACAVVTRDIEPFGIAVGNPAKVRRLRFSNQICAQLLEIAWWDWSPERIARNRPFFEVDLSSVADDYKLSEFIVD